MRTVASEMTSVPILDASTTVQDASAAMLDDRVEAAVIVDGAKLRGLLTAGDVMDALGQGHDSASTPVAAVASPDPLRVGAQELLAEAHQRMRAAQTPFAVVIGDDGRPVGLLADGGVSL